MIQIEPRNLTDRKDSKSLMILNADSSHPSINDQPNVLNDVHFTSTSEPSKFNVMNLVF